MRESNETPPKSKMASPGKRWPAGQHYAGLALAAVWSSVFKQCKQCCQGSLREIILQEMSCCFVVVVVAAAAAATAILSLAYLISISIAPHPFDVLYQPAR